MAGVIMVGVIMVGVRVIGVQQRGLGGQTPYERLKQKTQTQT